MTFDHWLIYLAAAIGLSLTPGPNGLLSLTHGLQFGFRSTVATAAGGMIGFLVLVGLSLSGLGALLAASEQAFTVTKWLGAAYLVYLGVQLWFAPPPTVTMRRANAGPGGQVAERSGWSRFSQGFLVAVSNPKALIFFAAFLPQFMMPGVSLWVQFLVLGGTFTIIEFFYELVLAAMAGRIGPWIVAHGRWFNRIAGATFIGIAALLTRATR